MTTGERLRILLIEDNPDDRDLIEVLLAAATQVEFDLIAAESLARGVEIAGEREFDAVLLDLSLPDSRGLDTYSRMHQHAPSLPIVVLTGHADEEVALEALSRGAQDYLVKGQIDSSLLVRAVRYAIERTKAAEQQRRSDERLRLVTDQLPAVIWTTDRELKFTSSAGTGLLVLALRPQQVVGMSLYDYFETRDETFPPLEAHLRALAGESMSFEFPWRGQSFHVHVEPLRNAAGTCIGTVGVALDVSDHKRMEENLLAARQVQQALFPRESPALPGFDIYGKVFPAEETAGDYFDYVPMPDGQWGIVVGDVAGHGLGPALLMTELRAYLRPLARMRSDVGEILTLANRFITDDLEDHYFVTIFLACIDPERRTLRYAGAGHLGYLFKADGQVRRLDSTGFPLGLISEEPVGSSTESGLESGDLILSLTDGFQEAHNAQNDLFGTESVLETVARHRDKPASEIIPALFETVAEFSESAIQTDDMTAVVIKCDFEA